MSVLDHSLSAVWQAALIYQRGIICPAVLWEYVTDALTLEIAASVLDDLPSDLQAMLCKAYAERPWSLRPKVGDSEVRKAVEQWCLSHSA